MKLRRPRWTVVGRSEGDPVTVMINGRPRAGQIEAVWSNCIDVVVDEPNWAGAGQFAFADESLTWCRGREPSTVAALQAAAALADSE